MGRKFLPYSAYNNNCQDFLMAILKSNKLGNQTVYKFVKQNTTSIFKTSPIFTKFTNFITDLGENKHFKRRCWFEKKTTP